MTNASHHIETSQLNCIANQLTGFYMMGNIVDGLIKLQVFKAGNFIKKRPQHRYIKLHFIEITFRHGCSPVHLFLRTPLDRCFWKLRNVSMLHFIEITLRLGCSPVNLLHTCRTPFLKNISRRLLLNVFLLFRFPSF